MVVFYVCLTFLSITLIIVPVNSSYELKPNFDIFELIQRGETFENNQKVLGTRHKSNGRERGDKQLWWVGNEKYSQDNKSRNLRKNKIFNIHAKGDKHSPALGKKLRSSVQNHRKAVVGGKNAPLNRYPYAVTLQYHYENYGYDHTCGASLIAPDIILSAAHCYTEGENRQLPRVIVGDHDLSSSKDNGEEFDTEFGTFHPDWDERLVANDLILFKLRGNSTKTIMRLNKNRAVPSDNQTLVVMGWGATDPYGTVWPDILKETSKEYLPNKYCFGMENAFEGILCSYDSDGKVDEDSCIGDSGGPIIIKGSKPSDDIQVGLSSWGANPCAQEKPAYWVRISDYYDWIRENVCTLSSAPPEYFDCSPNNESELPKDTDLSTIEKVSYTLTIRLDDYPKFVTWKVYDNNSGFLNPLYSNEKGYAKNHRSDFVHETFSLERNKSFHFSIHDVWEEWMCCDFGRSYYYLTLGTEESKHQEDKVIFWGEGVFGKHGDHRTFAFDSTNENDDKSASKSVATSQLNEFVTVQILFDDYPFQIDWSVSNTNLTTMYTHKRYGSYVASARQLVSEVVHVPHSEPIIFILKDKLGDGLLNGGFVKVFEGPPSDNKLLFEASNKFSHKSCIFELKENTSFNDFEVSLPMQIEPPSKVPLTLLITFDYFPEQTIWAIYEASDNDKQNPLYQNEKGYPSQYRFGTAIETIYLEANKNFTFTIGDYFGNGMCCQYGNGTYELNWDLPTKNIKKNKSILYGHNDFESYIDRMFTTSMPDTMHSSPTVSLSPSGSSVPSFEPTTVGAREKIPLTLVIRFDQYPKDIFWAVFPSDPENSSAYFSSNEAVYQHFEGYSSDLENKFVYEIIYLEPNKEYDLVMGDIWGDGICCDYGNGFYFLYWGIEENNEYKESLKMISSNGLYDNYSVHSFKTIELTSSPSMAPNDDYDYDYDYYYA